MDPGVLCPNSALEAIAWRAPQAAKDLRELRELKVWFQREFGTEVVRVSREGEESPRPVSKAVGKRPAAKAKP